VVLLLACVLWVPRWLYPSLTDDDLRGVRTAKNVPDAAKVQELRGARLKLQNDARTTLLQGLGAVLLLTGAGIGAAVTLRQIRVSQGQLQATREQMQHTLDATQQQLNLTEQGQVTDRYIRAVEQLGHEKAPVRLGALYSLEHLAQDNPEYRQTVVDILCAYLRMPYSLPTRTKPDAEQPNEAATAEDQDAAPHPVVRHDPAQEELQVRQTAQRLLADHLRCPPQTSGQDAQLLPPSPQQAFWPGISLDLTGATLVDFTLGQTSVIEAVFLRATFQGPARFVEANFQANANFFEATFRSYAEFDKASFQGDAWFSEASFHHDARFVRATFQGTAGFLEATFQGDTWLENATFQGHAGFQKASFQDTAWANRAIFLDTAGFFEATFGGDARFGGAHVLHLNNVGRSRLWPDGWTVRRNPIDPSRGTLIPAEDLL
jgi:hypothetical protein